MGVMFNANSNHPPLPKASLRTLAGAEAVSFNTVYLPPAKFGCLDIAVRRRIDAKGPFSNKLHIWLVGCGRAAALQMLAMPMGIAVLCALHRIPHPTAKCTTYFRTDPNC